jgi:hypothetical protein
VGEEGEGRKAVAVVLRDMLSPPLLLLLLVGETFAAWAGGGEISSVACWRTRVFRRGDADRLGRPAPLGHSGAASVSMRIAIIQLARVGWFLVAAVYRTHGDIEAKNLSSTTSDCADS